MNPLLAGFLCLGGRVHGEGVSQVRPIDAGGLAVEDSVDDGIAPLLSNIDHGHIRERGY